MKARMWRWAAVMGAVVAIVALGACNGGGGASVTLYATDSARTVELKRGDTLVVKLEGMPTTGFTWEVASVDASVLEQKGEPEYTDAEPGKLGGAGTLTFDFNTKGAGSTSLEMVYHQPWDKDTPPTETFEVTVVVE
jgi:inhibitor of cysteine peptidase